MKSDFEGDVASPLARFTPKTRLVLYTQAVSACIVVGGSFLCLLWQSRGLSPGVLLGFLYVILCLEIALQYRLRQTEDTSEMASAKAIGRTLVVLAVCTISFATVMLWLAWPGFTL